MTHRSQKEMLIESVHPDRTITLWTLSVPVDTPIEELRNLKEALKHFPDNTSRFRTLGDALRPCLGKNIENFSEIRPVSICSYRGELIHGPFEIYSQEGKLQEKGSYKYGKLHGEFESYDDHGNFTRKGTYTEGAQTGLWVSNMSEYIWYDNNGQQMTYARDFEEAVKIALNEKHQPSLNIPSPS